MGNNIKSKEKAFDKDIFFTGKYIQHFNPEDKQNPFYKIYRRKKQDTINIISKSGRLKRILDIGGGMGRLSLALAKSPGYRIVLCDVSIDMLKLVLKHTDSLDNIQAVDTDAHLLPFRENSFDLIVGLDLFCHLERPERALREFHRVLKNQGILILDSTNSNPLWALFYPRYLGKNPLNWLKIMKFKGVGPGWHVIVKHYPRKKFFGFIYGVGFKIIQNINYGPALCRKWHLAVARKIT